MAKEQTIQIYKGVHARIPFAFNPKPSGGIAGRTLKVTIKKNATDAEALITLTGEITDATACTGYFELVHADTADLDAGKYVFDAQCVDPGAEDVYAIGPFEILQEVLYP